VARLSSGPSRLGRMPALVAAAPKVALPFYQSVEWRTLVRAIKAERGAFCERCGSNKGLIADHVIELRDGGEPLDAANVELLCGKHHGAKTSAARAARASRPA
jgi:5-methylcytosine-specific restriction protein A